MTDVRKLVVELAHIADDKKAMDVVVLDLRKLTFVADYFIIATGYNSRQLQSIAYEMQEQCRREGLRCLGMHGYEQARWILVDYGQIVVHLFDEDARTFYNLDALWADAVKTRWARRSKAKASPSRATRKTPASRSRQQASRAE